MPRINLLPWRELERKRKRQEFFVALGAGVATAALVALFGQFMMGASIRPEDRNALLDRRSQSSTSRSRKSTASTRRSALARAHGDHRDSCSAAVRRSCTCSTRSWTSCRRASISRP